MADQASPLHPGEIALQKRAGVHERMDKVARAVIRDHMPEQHREFFALLPTVLLGACDAGGHPMATLLAGAPGFVSSPDPQRLQIALEVRGEDPVLQVLAPGSRVGLLGLQPHTRRRNRMNGTVLAAGPGGLEIGVDQSFGNCPKYIQGREPLNRVEADGPALPPAQRGGSLLAPALVELIAAADTFFIASGVLPGPSAATVKDPYGVDVSHRGGHPGFVQVEDVQGESVLTVPDFVGNYLFNTLGNLALNPACGLLFIDYAQGDLVHLKARAEILWDGEAVAAVPGAQRLLRLTVESSLWRPGALSLRWSPPVFSEHLPPRA